MLFMIVGQHHPIVYKPLQSEQIFTENIKFIRLIGVTTKNLKAHVLGYARITKALETVAPDYEKYDALDYN